MKEKIKSLVGQPIGVEFKNGLCISGILCDATDDTICLMEYLYQAKFVQRHYELDFIQGIYLFPPCAIDDRLN